MSDLSRTTGGGTAWVLPQVSLSWRLVPALCLCWVRKGASPADEQHKGERHSPGRGDVEVAEVGRGRWIEVAVHWAGGWSCRGGGDTSPVSPHRALLRQGRTRLTTRFVSRCASSRLSHCFAKARARVCVGGFNSKNKNIKNNKNI